MLAKLNCWEAMSCGREPGGARVDELGACPAATDTSTNGVNGGKNGGRLCWAVAGSSCGGTTRGGEAIKRPSCLQCEFFERVMREESMASALPTDVVESWSHRLLIMAIVCVALWSLYAALGLTVWADHSTLIGHFVALGATAASAALVLILLKRRPGQHSLVLLGFGFEAVMGLAISLGEFSVSEAAMTSSQVSWTCVLLLFFPLLVPASPRATLIGSLVTFATSPLGYGINVVLGAPAADGSAALLSRFLPQAVCVGLAYVSSRALNRLTTNVKQARRLGSYELVERLGAGGMGEVWRARHRMLVRPAAIKLIRAGTDNSNRMHQRFGREAQATSALESPHTVQLYDFGVADDGAFYYAMELLRGIDMQRLVTRFGAMPPARVVYLLRQACDSLDDAHRIGLIHRDIKPANIFLAVKGSRLDFVKVLDFGLVKSGPNSGKVGMTAEGEVIGTPAYLAPEMTTGASAVDGRADVYALGCVAYWLLTGKHVFEGTSAIEVAVAHVTLAPVPPGQRLGSPVPAALERIVLQCLAKEPASRPDARELGRRLQDCADCIDDAWTAHNARDWWTRYLPQVLQDSYIPGEDHCTSTASLFPV